MSLFNDAIAAASLREAARTGARFTWTNKQLRPVRSVLDRVFFTPEWEALFPMCSLVAETRIGSDHIPLIFSSGEEQIRHSSRFFFEIAWFEAEGFEAMVHERWAAIVSQVGPQRGPAEFWSAAAAKLRAFLRGWGANFGSESKKERAKILAQIATLDAEANVHMFSEQEWALRYALEEQVLSILRAEEEYWRRRGGIKWVTKGDANTGYFHAFANGRKRKGSILRLNHGDRVLITQAEICNHIYDFFIGLLGTAEEKQLCLREDLWGPHERVSQEENAGLVLSFLPEEIDRALSSMKTGTAPGPDRWPVEFFKKFWPSLKNVLHAIINGFALGQVDLARLNFGVISLIPKVKGTDNIKLFRPITLINVPFKLCAKAYAVRLTPIAQRVISRSQTGFIKGRNILEGPVALAEIVHELKRTKGQGVLLKLDFEQADDRVCWEFVREVLLKKGFDAGFVHRMMHLISCGNTAVSINGEMGKFFRNKRGLRQGDPSSPLIFNFVADALAAMVARARGAGHVKGVVPHLIPGGGGGYPK